MTRERFRRSRIQRAQARKNRSRRRSSNPIDAPAGRQRRSAAPRICCTYFCLSSSQPSEAVAAADILSRPLSFGASRRSSVPPLPRGPWPMRWHRPSSRQYRAIKDLAGRAGGGDAIVPRLPPAKAARAARDENGRDEAGQPVYGQITKPFGPLRRSWPPRNAESAGRLRTPFPRQTPSSLISLRSTPRKPAAEGSTCTDVSFRSARSPQQPPSPTSTCISHGSWKKRA